MGFTEGMQDSQRSHPNFKDPQSIFDLFNFVVFEFMSLSGSVVTRICEGDIGFDARTNSPSVTIRRPCGTLRSASGVLIASSARHASDALHIFLAHGF